MRPPDTMNLREFGILLREKHPEWIAGGNIARIINIIRDEACTLNPNPTLGMVRESLRERRPFNSEDLQRIKRTPGIGQRALDLFLRVVGDYIL